MQIVLRSLNPDGIRFDERLSLPDLTREGEEPVGVLEARLQGSAVPGPEGVDLTARLGARLLLRCSRCLEDYQTSLTAEFQLILVPDAVEFGADEAELDEREALLFYATDGRVELVEVAREQIYLNLPLKPVCHEGCRGLCPTCGANRNRLECGCRSEEIDPRLAPLADLKKRLRGS